MAVRTNLVAVKGSQVAAVFGGSGSEGLPGSGNPAVQCHFTGIIQSVHTTADKTFFLKIAVTSKHAPAGQSTVPGCKL